MTEEQHFIGLNAQEAGLVVYGLATCFSILEREEDAAQQAAHQFTLLVSQTPPEVIGALIDKMNAFTTQIQKSQAEQARFVCSCQEEGCVDCFGEDDQLGLELGEE